MFNHINVCIEGIHSFYKYKSYDLPDIKINFDDALYSLNSLVNAVRMTPYPVGAIQKSYIEHSALWAKTRNNQFFRHSGM